MSAFGTKRTSRHAQPMSAFGSKMDITPDTPQCPLLTQSGHCLPCESRYSPLVRRKETDRITGAASTTTGSIAAHEMTQDNSQWMKNRLIVTNGKLAIPAVIRHVNPA